MATGFMMAMSKMANRHFTSTVWLLLLFSYPASALDVGLAGVTGSRALLMIGGGEPQAVAVGQSIAGVKLLAIQGDQAIVEIDGRKRPLRVGQGAIGSPGSDAPARIIIPADGQGHFYTQGKINGTSVRFLVDTGATMISLGAADARRIGVNVSRGQQAMTNTANGQTVVTKVQLDSVRIGDVTLHNVDALIHPVDMPVALLGMSFLNRMDMQRDGSTMILKRRY